MSELHKTCMFDPPEFKSCESKTKDKLIINGSLNFDYWLCHRKKTITNLCGNQIPKRLGASDAGEICGLCGSHLPPYRPYSTPTQKWLTLLGRKSQKVTTPAMNRGHVQEPLIAAEYEKRFGPTRVTSVWTNHSWIAVSPDRLIPDGVLEIKSSDSDNIKLEWIIQVTYQMAVVGVRTAHLAICNLDTKRRLHVYEIRFSPELWDWIYRRLHYFYQCLLTEEEPIHLPYIKKEFKNSPYSDAQTPLGQKLPPWKLLKIKKIFDDVI